MKAKFKKGQKVYVHASGAVAGRVYTIDHVELMEGFWSPYYAYKMNGLLVMRAESKLELANNKLTGRTIANYARKKVASGARKVGSSISKAVKKKKK